MFIRFLSCNKLEQMHFISITGREYFRLINAL